MVKINFFTNFILITLLICKNEALFLPYNLNNKYRTNVEKNDFLSHFDNISHPNYENGFFSVHNNIYQKYDSKFLNDNQEQSKNDNNFEKRKTENNYFESFVPIAKPSWAGIGGVWGKRSNQNYMYRNNLMFQKLFG